MRFYCASLFACSSEKCLQKFNSDWFLSDLVLPVIGWQRELDLVPRSHLHVTKMTVEELGMGLQLPSHAFPSTSRIMINGIIWNQTQELQILVT